MEVLMKSKKTIVYEFIHTCTSSITAEEEAGVTTQYVSDRLAMQRTNVSSILNELTAEGLIEKINGRPVLYRVKSEALASRGEASCFNQLIGHDGSLKNAIQLAKAAILYPRRSLHSLIMGPPGSGKSYFASLIYEFAKENRIIKETAPYIRFNCLNYSDNTQQMENELFGAEGANNLAAAEGGVLFIDNVELLPATARNTLLRIVESNILEYNGIKKELNVIIICAMNDTVNRSLIENYSKYFFIKIPIPSLQERTFPERFSLIQHFLTIEAGTSNKTININREVFIGLLLYPCDNNVKQLQRDIQLGCANAYVREFHTDKQDIVILMSDFPYQVRTGFLNFKTHKTEIKELISDHHSYAFTKEKATLISSKEGQADGRKSMYSWIDEKATELSARGIQEQDINFILSIDIENEFKQYSRKLSEQIVDKEQLSQIVDKTIISMVSDFIEAATGQFNKVYPVSVFYGLCLHLNSTLSNPARNKSQRLGNEQIMDIIKNNEAEYGHCLKFVSQLEAQFQVKLPIDEVIFLTLFLTKGSADFDNKQRPVLLIALHGDHAARSIVEVVNSLSGYSAYSYDMPLDKSTKIAYEELKSLILKIHQGKGVFVLYDMGSFRTMCEMISAETGIEIRSLEVPITLLGLDCNRKVMIGRSLDEVYNEVNESFREIIERRNDSYQRSNSNNVILTLCMSGEGGAVQIKRYIEKNLELNGVEIISLSVSDSQLLLEEVNKLKEKHHIICAVGSVDPQLIGIHFISITDIFQNELRELQALLQAELPSSMLQKGDDDFEVIFDHLSEELAIVNVDKLRRLLPAALKKFAQASDRYLLKEQELALMVHIACCIEHMLEGGEMPINRNKQELMDSYPQMYQELKRSFAPLEQEFNIVFDDNELANIISIINSSANSRAI